MNGITLSWIITTRNKLFLLQEVVNRLIKNVQADEEIIIIDGASTDGTVEYLCELHSKGLIQQFVSEPDRGEAHGFNKGFLLAKGALVKVITDDDVFYYEGIRQCKAFMLEHPEIDVIGTEGAGTDWHLDNPYGVSQYIIDYQNWRRKGTPFSFCGLGLLIRKSAFAYLGLFNTGFVRVDAEYTFRITSLEKLNLAWYTGCTWVRMINPKSNSSMYSVRVARELEVLENIYLNKNLKPIYLEELYFKKLIQLPYKILNKCHLILTKTKSIFFSKGMEHKTSLSDKKWEVIFQETEEWLVQINRNTSSEFIKGARYEK